MKWRKTPADLLSEKTFLVIREDLETIEEDNSLGPRVRERPCVVHARGGISCCSCDTWPRMRKKRPRKTRASAAAMCNESGSDCEEPRPATASLEAPLVLDPRLVDKLDMSLLSKESLNASLTRINLGFAKDTSKTRSSTEATLKYDNCNSSSTTARPRARFAAGAASSPCRASSRKASVDNNSCSESDMARTTTASGGGSRFEGPSSPEAKRLDDNNNKNKSAATTQPQPQAQQQLSPLLRSRSSRSPLSPTDVALFASKKKAPATANAVEPCRACGRAAQPERFHSHPKSQRQSPGQSPRAKDSPSSSPLSPTTTTTTALASARSSPSVIPVRASPAGMLVAALAQGGRSSRKASARVQKEKEPTSPATTSPRCEQTGSSLGSTEDKLSSDEATSRRERKVSSATIAKPIGEETSALILAAKRRPRSVTCYICGREFGSASFPIHEPKCLQKWQRENKTLPSSLRRNAPQRPSVSIDHEDWNVAAWEQSQALLIPCLKCKRTFLPDRLAIHDRNCRAPTKGPRNSSSSRAYSKSPFESQSALVLASGESSGRIAGGSSSLSRRSPKENQSHTGLTATVASSAKRSSRIAVREKSAYERR